MIIDFHTHTYPSKIAEMIVERLSGPSNVKAYTDATASGLSKSCEENGIDKCIILPVATNPRQTEILNNIAFETNSRKDRLLSFGAIHPDNTDYRHILTDLVSEGIKGVKLHPIFQKTYFDDIKYMRIIDCASELGLIISVHVGYDINNPGAKYVTVAHMRGLLKTVKPQKMVLAHMGGHLCWNEAEEMIEEYLADAPGNKSLYLDTAFSLPSPVQSQNISYDFLTNEQFIRMVRLIGSDRVLFGTDSPWTDQGASIAAIKNSGLTEKEISRILYKNAEDLLSQ